MTTENNQSSTQTPQGPAPPLVSYYRGTLAAPKCLARIRSEGKFSSPDTMQHELLGELQETDPDLAKTWNLVKGDLRKAQPAPVLVEWLHRVMTTVQAPAAAPQSVRQAVATLTGELLPAKGPSTKRGLNAWRLGVLDLCWQRELGLEQLAVTLAEHFVRASDRADTVEARVLSTVMTASKAQLNSIAAIVSWMTRLNASQAIELSRIRGELEAARDQRAELKSRVSALEGNCERLIEQLQEAEGREAQVRQSLLESEDAATLRLHGLAGQAAGTLTGRVLPLLQQIEDALTMAEPSVRAAREFVNTARTESEGLSQWLRAVSTSEPPTA